MSFILFLSGNFLRLFLCFFPRSSFSFLPSVFFAFLSLSNRSIGRLHFVFCSFPFPRCDLLIPFHLSPRVFFFHYLSFFSYFFLPLIMVIGQGRRALWNGESEEDVVNYSEWVFLSAFFDFLFFFQITKSRESPSRKNEQTRTSQIQEILIEQEVT